MWVLAPGYSTRWIGEAEKSAGGDTKQDGSPAQFHGDPLLTDELVVTGSDRSTSGYVYAFEKATGEVRWKTEVGGLETDITRFQGSVIGGATGGSLVALDLQTGKLRWKFTTETDPYRRYFTETPALVEENLYFGGPDGSVYSLKAETGDVQWKRELGSRVMTPIRAIGQHLFVGVRERKVYRLSRSTGAIDAELETQDFPHHSLVGAEDSLLVLLGESTLVSLDLDLRGVRWSRAAGEWNTFRPLVLHDVVIVGNGSGELFALRILDGSHAWSHKLGGVLRGLGESGTILYIGTLDGPVHALRYP